MHRRNIHGSDRAFVHEDALRHSPSLQQGDPALILVKGLARKAWQSNRVRMGMALWLLGVFFMMFAPSPKTLTTEMKKRYEQMIVEAADAPAYEKALRKYQRARFHADEAKVWFWRFREPHKTIVRDREKSVSELKSKLDHLDADREKKMTKAKQFVGIWSDYGMHDVRNRFWGAYDKGKMFAQQQTFYHMIMYVLSGRNEDILSTILNWVFVALANFTTGLIGSLFYFIFSLIGMIYSYQPDPFSAVAFFVLGILGAGSVVASYLIGVYGMVASGMYVVSKAAARNALQNEARHHIRHEQR
uniref:Uncharacterized protein AlNc14C131G6958 n=1 Tax=Albugo laibachii Nc14 TaxID=890382 RepID=F0WKA5_9STRA|nr:conserved hypothetical protein [Albugo laibachii Nc14]CCA21866.1 conserved hypothetical protein [Albugo laibachii Nc14]|eukprot:CCA21866.1 conserved hypothetical protein [Albugo laibachii Nc14]